MAAAVVAITFAIVAALLLIALFIAAVPLFLLLAIGLVLLGTGLLLVSWTPVAFFASLGMYVAAVLVGLGAISWIAFGLSTL